MLCRGASDLPELGDEIDVVAKVFEEMATSLKERQGRLEEKKQRFVLFTRRFQARSYMKSAYGKMGISHQGELISRVLASSM